MPLIIDPLTGTEREEDSLAKVLVYGDIKTKKTWWALRAAEAGFNVTLLDGDHGHHIKAKLPQELRKKIAYIPLVDETGEAHFHNFIARMYKNKAWAINETRRESIYAGDAKQYSEGDSHVYFDPTKLSSNDVLIVDSWSAFCRSMALHWKIVNNSNTVPSGNQADKDIGRQAWEDYGWGKALSMDVLGMLRGLPCHVVLIAHSMEHKVMEKEDMGGGKSIERIKSQTMQPIGYSGPQGRIIGQFFTDILYMHLDKFDKYRISTKPLFDAVGGSRILDPKIYTWDELSWPKYISLSKGAYKLPENVTEFYDSKAFEFLPPTGEQRLPTFLREQHKKSAEATEGKPKGSRLGNLRESKV